jgi:hypothetical protein
VGIPRECCEYYRNITIHSYSSSNHCFLVAYFRENTFWKDVRYWRSATAIFLVLYIIVFAYFYKEGGFPYTRNEAERKIETERRNILGEISEQAGKLIERQKWEGRIHGHVLPGFLENEFVKSINIVIDEIKGNLFYGKFEVVFSSRTTSKDRALSSRFKGSIEMYNVFFITHKGVKGGHITPIYYEGRIEKESMEGNWMGGTSRGTFILELVK